MLFVARTSLQHILQTLIGKPTDFLSPPAVAALGLAVALGHGSPELADARPAPVEPAMVFREHPPDLRNRFLEDNMEVVFTVPTTALLK
eukprot:8821739-Alexandrium_andersonii.AAC.1